MLLTDEELQTRVSSNGNLLNRLGLSIDRSKVTVPALPASAIQKNIIDVPSIPSSIQQETLSAKKDKSLLTIDELITDVDTQIEIGHAQVKAISLLNKSLDKLTERLDEVEKPEKLARIAFNAHQIVFDNRRKFYEVEDNNKPQIIIYKPMMLNIDQMNVVEIAE